MQQNSKVFVGLDTSKLKISVAVAEDGRQGEVRFLGEIDNTPEAVRRLVSKLGGKHRAVLFCYEAGPTGSGLQRQISALGHECAVIAPSLIPKRPGERVKTTRRDALTLVRLHRAGELTAIWVPDPGHEAVRELLRAREAAMADLREKRQHLQSFLLRHGRIFPGRKPGTRAHARWLSELIFEHLAQYLVLREYRQAIEDAETRLERLTQQVAEVVKTWSMAPVVEAYQALRGVALLTAVTFVAETGDVRRFESPRRLMADLGLVPCESSTGERVRRFAEVRRHLGVETQRQWSDRAIARTTPALLGLFSLVTLWAGEALKDGWMPRRAAWYAKSHLTFSDALALVRAELWAASFETSWQVRDVVKIPRRCSTASPRPHASPPEMAKLQLSIWRINPGGTPPLSIE
jgi:transposase